MYFYFTKLNHDNSSLEVFCRIPFVCRNFKDLNKMVYNKLGGAPCPLRAPIPPQLDLRARPPTPPPQKSQSLHLVLKSCP